jgi:hypothetical protein
VTGCCRCNRIPGATVPLPLNGEAISMATDSYSDNKPAAVHCECITDVSPVTNPSQRRNEPWGKVSTIPSAHAHLKTGILQIEREPAKRTGEESESESRQSVSEPAGEEGESERGVSSWRERIQREPRVDSE